MFDLEMNPNKDNPLGVHSSDALCIKEYWGWDHKHQRGDGFDELKK